MRAIIQVARHRQSLVWLGCWLVAGMGLCLPLLAPAHEVFAAYIQHRVTLTVGARHIDLEVDMTFFEEWSAHERKALDSDANGRITRSEVEGYAKRFAPEWARQVKLCLHGQELALTPLYSPEIDLLGSDQVGRAHHRLRLLFFVATPTTLDTNSCIVVEDRLWPTAKALGLLQAEGRDDCVLEAVKTGDPSFAPLRADQARRFVFRCLRPPSAGPDASVASRTNAYSSSIPAQPQDQPSR